MAAQRRLNRDELIATALTVADGEGLDAVTIRRVAQQHDVTPMALYRHFPDKEGLLDAIAERLFADVRIPEPDDRPWHAQMEDLLGSVLLALRPHPNASTLLFTRVLTCEPGLDLAERVLALLADGGLSTEEAAETAAHAMGSLVSLVITEPGRTTRAAGPEVQEDQLRARRTALLGLSPRRYPHVVAAADSLAECASEEVYYRRGVELIVTGMRGVRPGPAAVRTAAPTG